LESLSNLVYLAGHAPDLPEQVKAYLVTAEEELHRIVRITKQTLSFCRESPVPASLHLGELLDQVLGLYTRHIARKRLDIVRQFEDSEPITIYPGEIRQVFSNLIVNAIEASSEGGELLLRVRKSRLWKDPGVIGQRVTIADSGTGMEPEVRRRIGEPFFSTKGQSGTGLGLWITQSIVKSFGGNLFLRSSTGQHHGTVFSVFLPGNLRPHVVASNGPVKRQRALRGESPHRHSRSHARGA
jgi:two-component system, NtrC family, sensor kinase